MAEAAAKTPISRRNSGDVDKYYSGESESTALMIFGFLEENEWSSESSCNSGDGFDGGEFVDEEEEVVDESSCNVEETRVFWESQEQLVQVNFFYFF